MSVKEESQEGVSINKPEPSQEGTREHRIGLLSQRIKALEDEHVFTKERKAELSNLRKKLRIDRNNQARYEKQQQKLQPAQSIVPSESAPQVTVKDEPQPVQQEEEMPQLQNDAHQMVTDDELVNLNEQSVSHYTELIRKQLEEEEAAIEQQKLQQQKHLEDIRNDIKQMQSRWEQDKDIKQVKTDFTQVYGVLRQNKSKRTLIGEAIYKLNRR